MKLIHFLDNSNIASSMDTASEAGHVFAEPCAEPGISMQQLYQLQECLQSDLLACDVRFSLFVAAANSYRYETLLRPFPREFLDSEQRPNIGAIFQVIADIDRLEVILDQLDRGNYGCYHVNVLSLLHAVLVRHGERVALSTLRPSEFTDLYAHLQIGAPQVAPTQIIEVTPSLRCSHTKAYTALRERYPVRIGFYGGRAEQLYAMLTVGCLPTHTALELSRDVDEALQHSPEAPGWGGSRCGALLRCVAIVEYVLQPEMVSVERNGTGHVSIADASCIQISYLLLFGQNCESDESDECDESVERRQCSRLVRQPKFKINLTEVLRWMESNKYVLSLGMYLMLMSLTTPSGRGILHRFACTGMCMLRRGFLKI
ncbi:protein mono-ADP-ribosyltransferase Parp16 [Drosophila mojavensis]|uniref:PARP16 N-terminal domain-containing protein n=1 Tax=Drosophila mojavensis TaxID=7230 RepID=B4KSH5_DROMO|nr:protein mono-ADP-ribosyltransferase Parp16 [Drosophila mojavensis]EDW09480.1 uncharacterized protein Dmoj_GI20525 [Drosophila mojavensis]